MYKVTSNIIIIFDDQRIWSGEGLGNWRSNVRWVSCIADTGTEKCIKIFQSYDQKCTATFLVNHSVQSLLCSSHVGMVLLSQPFVCLFVCCEQKKN